METLSTICQGVFDSAAWLFGVHKILHEVPFMRKVLASYIAVAAVLMFNGVPLAFFSPYYLSNVWKLAIECAIQLWIVQLAWVEHLKRRENDTCHVLVCLMNLLSGAYTFLALVSFATIWWMLMESTNNILERYLEIQFNSFVEN